VGRQIDGKVVKSQVYLAKHGFANISLNDDSQVRMHFFTLDDAPVSDL
jgi:hypothetical protein